MTDHRGVNLQDVDVVSDMFNGIKFGTHVTFFTVNYVYRVLVVASDPASRTGEQDKRDLLRLLLPLFTICGTATYIYY